MTQHKKNATEAMKQRWQTVATRHLLGRKIVAIRWMTPEEQKAMGWDHAAVVLILDNLMMIWPSADDEGNDAGALFGNDRNGNDVTLPVI